MDPFILVKRTSFCYQLPFEAACYKRCQRQYLERRHAVSVIKDLKVKGSSSVIKIGTKVKNILLIAGDHAGEAIKSMLFSILWGTMLMRK